MSSTARGCTGAAASTRWFQRVTAELTGVRVDVEPRRHAVPVHDAVLDLSVDPHVGVVGLDAQDERPRRLVLQDGGIQAVVLTLGGQVLRNGDWPRLKQDPA